VQVGGFNILMATSSEEEGENTSSGSGSRTGGGVTAKKFFNRKELKEYNELKEKYPEWMPPDDDKFRMRSKAETADARAEAKGSGHHRHPLKFGGDPNPSEGLVTTGDTRKNKNPIHALITNFWNSIMRSRNN
jgi:hypothetical protein